MSDKLALLEARFRVNMNRIGGLVRFALSGDASKPMRPWADIEGPRADILRAAVVFLHATFELTLRSQIVGRRASWNFHSRADLDKVLKLANIDVKPFQELYPPLTQMAKRRHQIVHEADLSTERLADWNLVDGWQLTMWMFAVLSFYYELRISLRASSIDRREMRSKLRVAMASHVKYGQKLVALARAPRERYVEVLQEIKATVENILVTLRVDSSA